MAGTTGDDEKAQPFSCAAAFQPLAGAREAPARSDNSNGVAGGTLGFRV